MTPRALTQHSEEEKQGSDDTKVNAMMKFVAETNLKIGLKEYLENI